MNRITSSAVMLRNHNCDCLRVSMMEIRSYITYIHTHSTKSNYANNFSLLFEFNIRNYYYYYYYYNYNLLVGHAMIEVKSKHRSYFLQILFKEAVKQIATAFDLGMPLCVTIISRNSPRHWCPITYKIKNIAITATSPGTTDSTTN